MTLSVGRGVSTPLVMKLRTAVTRALDLAGATWYDDAQHQIKSDRALLVRLFPAVSRKCGSRHLWPVEPDLVGWTVDDAVRVLLLIGATLDEVTAAYTYGDTAEKRAVLRALPLLDLGDAAVPLVLDALDSNNTRLIAVAVGPYAAEHLPADTWRQAVLTCVTQAVPLAWVADLQRRTDAQLINMLRAYAQRRLDADLCIPPDLFRLVPDSDISRGNSAGDTETTAPHNIP